MTGPRVTAVIPTRGRADLVVRAARSALGQTLRGLEVVVVLDGPDPAAAEAIASIGDSRLRAVTLRDGAGPAAARNAGVRAAAAPWVAFLDDDDEWLAGKLEAQLAAAARAGVPRPIVAARVLARDGDADRVWPRRLPGPEETLPDYVLARSGLFWGETLVHTSTILAPRHLLIEVPFREGPHEDLDWLARAAGRSGVALVFVPGDEPLAIWNVDESHPRRSAAIDWRASLAWIRSVRPLVSRRAYAGFVLGLVMPAAARQRCGTALPLLLVEAFRHGRPRAADLVPALGSWIVPVGARRRLGDRLATRHRSALG